MVPSAPSGHETPFLSSLTLGRFTPGSDQKRSGGRCLLTKLPVCLADRQNVCRRLPDLLIGQHFAPRRHANAVFLPTIRDRNEHALGVEHAPSEIDAALAVLAVAMSTLLLQEQVMTGCNHFRVFEIRYLVGVRSFDRRAKGKALRTPSSRYSTSFALGKSGAARLSRPNCNYFETLKAISVEAAGTFSSCGNNAGIRIAA